MASIHSGEGRSPSQEWNDRKRNEEETHETHARTSHRPVACADDGRSRGRSAAGYGSDFVGKKHLDIAALVGVELPAGRARGGVNLPPAHPQEPPLPEQTLLDYNGATLQALRQGQYESDVDGSKDR